MLSVISASSALGWGKGVAEEKEERSFQVNHIEHLFLNLFILLCLSFCVRKLG